MIRLEGSKDFAQAPAELWPKVSDARFLVQSISGLESVSQSDSGKAICVLRPGFAFVRGTLELTVEVVEAVPEKSVRLLLHSKGIGSTSEAKATLELTPEQTGTRLHWIAEIKSLGGLLKAVPQGLIKASAQKVVADALVNVENRLAHPC